MILPRDDLELGINVAGEALTALRGARVLITGGTGFIGRNVLELLLGAERELGLGLELYVVSFDPRRFAAWAPDLAAHPLLHLLQGDIRSFVLPPVELTHVLHGAASSTASPYESTQDEVIDAIVNGTRRAVQCASERGASRFLFLSTGAVYGPQPPDLAQLGEAYCGAPCPFSPERQATYGSAKRLGERVVALASADGLSASVARLFALVGPYLPQGEQLAAGNFIRDGLAGGPIRVMGDGSARRGYLYAVEMAAWLVALLVRGASGRAYNVGSDADVSILQLASAVSQAFEPRPSVVVAKEEEKGRLAERYVPSIERARRELGLAPRLDLISSVRRTVQRWQKTPW